MPWTGKSFAEKHNKKLKGAAADRAAAIANALLRDGKKDGDAVRIANSQAKKFKKSRAEKLYTKEK